MKALDVDFKDSLLHKLLVEQSELQGRLKEGREVVLRLGTKRFGKPDAATVAAIEAITDLPRLETLQNRLLSAASWAELMAEA